LAADHISRADLAPETSGLPRIVHITPHFAVAGALEPADFHALAALGFKAVISNLPDGGTAGQLASVEEERLATDAGLAFRHVPVVRHSVFSDETVAGMTRALQELDAPVLAHCGSGQRSALAWAAAAARAQPADCVIAVLRNEGIDLSPVQEELAALYDPGLAGPIPPALDCRCGDTGEAVRRRA
jgi:sulfide:quinone oxidoreductase